jgi:hypothetical protein
MISNDQRSPNLSSEILTGQPERRFDLGLPGTSDTVSISLAECKLWELPLFHRNSAPRNRWVCTGSVAQAIRTKDRGLTKSAFTTFEQLTKNRRARRPSPPFIHLNFILGALAGPYRIAIFSGRSTWLIKIYKD